MKMFFGFGLLLYFSFVWAFTEEPRFTPEKNGVQLGAPRVLFSLQEKPLMAEIGGYKIPLGQVEAQYAKRQDHGLFRFTWPSELIEPDFIAALEDGTQNSLLAENFSSGSYELTQDLKLKKKTHSNDNVFELKAPLSFFEKKPQLCLSQSLPEAIKTLCFDSGERQRPTTLALNGLIQATRGFYQLEKEKLEISILKGPVSFFAESPVPDVQLYEVTELDSTTLRVRTSGSPLFGDVKSHNKRTPFFQHTIGDLKVYYETTVLKEAPILRAASSVGIQFQYPILGESFPLDNSRPSVLGRTYLTSYAHTLNLQLNPLKDFKVSSSQNKVSEDWVWEVATPEKNKMNTAELKTKAENGKESTLELEFYRGSRTYLSARLGFSIAEGGWSIVGDFLGTHWLNEPFGKSDIFSRQRWGITAGQLSTFVAENSDKYSLRNFDLLYRFTPGAAGWTETFGLGLGVLDFQYQDLDPVGLMGAGVFWSRSLPNWFNYLFGFLPFFRKPKWADVHVMIYPSSLKTGVTGNSVQVRATGRIELTPTTYFEGGWGIGNTTYTDSVNRKKVDLMAGRGFLGFGMRF
jgi:hypothetical protein